MAEIAGEASDEDSALRAFAEAAASALEKPRPARALGVAISVAGARYEGNRRRGLTLICRQMDGKLVELSAADVELRKGTGLSRVIAAYRHWVGLPPYPKGTVSSTDPVNQPVELAVLAVESGTATCRRLANQEQVLLRGKGLDSLMAPGQVVMVNPEKVSRYLGTETIKGSIVSVRLDAAALQLTPLRLIPQGMWDPEGHYWGPPGEPLEAWEKAIIAWGPRPQFELEYVLPGSENYGPDCDPIIEAAETQSVKAAAEILMGLCRADLRCLDAHAHLGNLYFDRNPVRALTHYEAGVRIGELSLGASFEGVLSWMMIDNRPFLRCLHGYGLCLWVLRRKAEALAVFERMLWLNPNDNQGIRFLLEDVQRGVPWGRRRYD